MPLRSVTMKYTNPRVRKAVFRVLEGNVLCSISTVAPGNRAHINTAYFCYSKDLEFYFLSDPDSLHCRNLKTNPSMAMTIFSSAQPWGNPGRGIQLFGRGRDTNGREATRAERLYGRRFPLYGAWLQGASEGDRRQAAVLRAYRFYRFLPTHVKILDESEFGGGVFVTAALRKGRRLRTGKIARRRP